MKTLTSIALGLILVSGCTYTVYTTEPAVYTPPDYVVVGSAPPPLRVAVAQPAQPQSDAYWVAGHWSWEGGWVWIQGEWQVPQPGYAWQQPVAVQVGTGYRYYPGYWHRRGQQPAPQYRQPGTIRVAVAQPGSQSTVQTAPTQTVNVQPGRPSQTVTVQPGQPSRPSQTVTVQPGQPSRPSQTVTVQPGQPTRPSQTVTVSPGRPAQPNTTVTVQPAHPNTQRPGVVVQPATARPGVVVQPATARPLTPNTQRPGVVVQQALSCRLSSTVVPEGGLLTITGTGLAGVTVRIGGRVSPVVSSNNTTVQARAPGGAGGAVSVSVGSQRASCGNVRVMRGMPVPARN